MNIRMIAVFFIVVILIGIYAALSLDSTVEQDKPTGVLLAAPPDYSLLSRTVEAMSINEAAIRLLNSLDDMPEQKKVALKYLQDGTEQLLLVDTGEDVIYNNAFNANGTIVQTTWRGSARQRLITAGRDGNLSPEGLEGPSRRNLYH